MKRLRGALGRAIATRLRALLQEDPGPSDRAYGGPPEHWVERVRRGAPGLLAMPSGRADGFEAGTDPPAHSWPSVDEERTDRSDVWPGGSPATARDPSWPGPPSAARDGGVGDAPAHARPVAPPRASPPVNDPPSRRSASRSASAPARGEDAASGPAAPSGRVPRAPVRWGAAPPRSTAAADGMARSAPGLTPPSPEAPPPSGPAPPAPVSPALVPEAVQPASRRHSLRPRPDDRPSAGADAEAAGAHGDARAPLGASPPRPASLEAFVRGARARAARALERLDSSPLPSQPAPAGIEATTDVPSVGGAHRRTPPPSATRRARDGSQGLPARQAPSATAPARHGAAPLDGARSESPRGAERDRHGAGTAVRPEDGRRHKSDQGPWPRATGAPEAQGPWPRATGAPAHRAPLALAPPSRDSLAHPWPELPPARDAREAEVDEALREWERVRRLDREQARL
jgi:hypothetical protein